MEHISLRRAKELVIDIVDAAGDDYVYERIPVMPRVEGISDVGECRYEYDGKPSCLVGHVLFRAGAPVESLKFLDRVGVDAGQLSDPVYEWDGDDNEEKSVALDVDRDAALMLMRVQGMQDNGDTWGECAEVAKSWRVIDCE